MTALDLPMGCLMDFSHGKAIDLDLAIIGLAVGQGFTYVSTWPNGRPFSPNDEDYGQVMTEIADEAVAWLNDRLGDGTFLAVEDNSLFHYYAEDAGSSHG